MTTDTLRRILAFAQRMAATAQSIRIQQVQATIDWEPHYKSIADKAWSEFNVASESLEAEVGKLLAEKPK